MTPQEVIDNYDQIIKVFRSGIVCGWDYTQITDYNLKEKTPNGTGTVTTIRPFSNKKFWIKQALSQIELYQGNDN